MFYVMKWTMNFFGCHIKALKSADMANARNHNNIHIYDDAGSTQRCGGGEGARTI